MQRFFVKEEQINNNKVTIIGTDVNHIRNVLRYTAGDAVEICVPNSDIKYECIIENINKDDIIMNIQKQIKDETEAGVYINIIQGLPKSEKMELIIQKCTELGVKEFTPIALKNCVVKLNEKDKIKKIERWQTIAEVASKQCKRNVIPKVNTVHTVTNIFDILRDYDIIFLAYENEKDKFLKEEIEEIKLLNKKQMKIGIIIGPEGGFDYNEVIKLQENGAVVISLGNRILRTETVALALTSILMYELGDIGGVN